MSLEPAAALEHIDCILCGRDDTVPYKEENGFQAVRCRGCGLVYVNPRPDGDAIRMHYESRESSGDPGRHVLDRDAKTIQARKCLKLIRRHQDGGRLLEVGSAAGWFLLEARRLGFEVQGIDISSRMAAFAREVLGVPAIEGVLADAPFEGRSFDVIFMRNVLSHLARPRDDFQSMHRLLRPGGLLILETGNIAELSASRSGELELPEHLFHFSEKTIRTLLALSGFRWIRTHRYVLPTQLPLVRALERHWGRLAGAAGRVTREPLARVRPRRMWRRRIAATAGVFLRYDVGRLLPRAGARCTLIVIARRA